LHIAIRVGPRAAHRYRQARECGQIASGKADQRNRSVEESSPIKRGILGDPLLRYRADVLAVRELRGLL